MQLEAVRNPWRRRAVVLLLLAVCTLLTLFPQRFRAVTSLTPSDPASLGLSGTLGQLGAVNSVFGNQAATEVSLKIAESPYVANAVMRQLDLPKLLDRTPLKTQRWLDRRIDIRVMRGGIIQIETTLRDPKLGLMLVSAYTDQLRNRLSTVARNQTAYKRKVLIDLVLDSSKRLGAKQEVYDDFRRRTHYSAPEANIPDIGSRIPQLEGMIKGKQMELATARKFATRQNFTIMRLEAELAAIGQQLAEARSTSEGDPFAVGRVVRQSTQAERLKRDRDIALSLYLGYKRYLEGTAVEDLASDASIRLLEPAYIDPERQYNWTFVAIGAVILLGALALEFYTLRTPLGDPVPA